MGEVVVCPEEALELEVLQEVESEKRRDAAAAGSPAMVRWERFLPRMVLRVLLVEADDSTRQIISALLRKCSYKVAAVPDGLKAWEVLKGRPHSIDLVLTEVELPSISGFALLTLTMEHDICKNIPVIMMSSHDSISTVYKCMLRGAADFLVKPLRRNELRNLWQHVWRRQSSNIGKIAPNDDSNAQQKVEATAENNATSNHSSGYKACVQMNKECIEKGSDAQSSCTKPDMEAESTYMDNVQTLSQAKRSRSLVSDFRPEKHDEVVKSGPELLRQENEAGAGPAVPSNDEANGVSWNKDIGQGREIEDLDHTGEACANSHLVTNSSKEAIDLIGAFDNTSKFSYRVHGSDIVQNKFCSSPQLDLSLRRSHPSDSENQIIDEKQTLNHSNGSAFSRYINRTSQPIHPESVYFQERECGTETEKNTPTPAAIRYNSDASVSAVNTQGNMITMATGHFGQSETMLSSSQERHTTVSVPGRGIFDPFCTGFGSVPPPVFQTQSGPSPIHNSRSARFQESSVLHKHQSSVETSGTKQLFEPLVHNANSLGNPNRNKEEHNLNSFDDQGYHSSATDQSASSRFCNGNASHLNNIGGGSICGSNGISNPASLIRTSSEGGNEEGLSTQDANSQRSLREMALNKFRLKRKDRCFEKKVRYESRKKLAEQRPRVKGQFVRQPLGGSQPGETNNY